MIFCFDLLKKNQTLLILQLEIPYGYNMERNNFPVILAWINKS